MSGENTAPESIEERINCGEKVCFPFWTKGDEVGIWLVLVMFLGIDSAFLFVEGGSTTMFLVFLPFCLIPFGRFWFMRRGRIGKELILDDTGVHLKSEQSSVSSISWESLEGLYRSKGGLTILASNGSEILMNYTMGGIKLKKEQDDIVNYIVERSRWIDEKRELVPEPWPRQVARTRLIWSSVVGTAVFTVLGYYVRRINTGELEVTDLPFGLEWLVGAGVFCAIASYIAFRAWYQLEVRKRPYLWDRSMPTPPTEPPDIEKHRKNNKKRTPRIEMESGKTYVYRKYSVSSGQMRLSLFGGAIFTMLLLSAPVVAYLDDSQLHPLSAEMVVITLSTWSIAAFIIIYIVWAAMWLKPYLSKYRLDGDVILVEYKGIVRKYATSTVREGKLWFFPTYFGGKFEVFGDDNEKFRLDRRYLREFNEGEYFDLR